MPAGARLGGCDASRGFVPTCKMAKKTVHPLHSCSSVSGLQGGGQKAI